MNITSAIELFDELYNIIGDRIISLLKEVRLKDKYGQIWDITNVEFSEKATILRIRLGSTDYYSAIVLDFDSWDESRGYELIKKDNEDYQ